MFKKNLRFRSLELVGRVHYTVRLLCLGPTEVNLSVYSERKISKARKRKKWGCRGVRAQRCDCNTTVVSSIPTRGMNYFLLIRFFAPAPKQKAGVEFRHTTRSSKKNSPENEERSVLILGFLYLHCYVRYTA